MKRIRLTILAAVLLTSSAEGKEIAGRLAVKAGSGVITDAVAVSVAALAFGTGVGP